MLTQLCNDVRYAARRLTMSPGFTAAAVVTIALGVGINTGVFSILNGIALRDLPAPDAGELVSIHQRYDEETRRQRPISGSASRFSTSEYRAYRDGARTLSIMGYSGTRDVTLGTNAPQTIAGTLVTCNYFDVLRQPPALGPGLAADCDADGVAPTVVLGHEVWTTSFGSDPTIVGREVLLNRQAFTVVGVAAEGMRGVDLEPAAFFAPISTQPLLNVGWDEYRGEWSWLALIGRKNDETSLERVRAELGVIAAQIDQQQAPRKTVLSIDRARPVSSPEDRSELVPIASLVLAAFALVLLIACANVANLLLARATGRTREIAVRLSLGASRGRIVQQLLAESVLLALFGGLLGAVLAVWSVQAIVAYTMGSLPAEVPALAFDTSPDLRVLGFALALTLASGALFGLAPALQLSKPDVQTAMKGDALGVVPRSRGRLLGGLLGTQVAICMVLMIAAGLLLRGLHATQSVDPGFAYENVTVVSYDSGGAGYDAARTAAFERELLERVGALPGVEAVAQAASTPLGTSRIGLAMRLLGQEEWMSVHVNAVSPSYFSLVDIPIVRGRTFTAAELATGSDAVIVTEATARDLWPDREPLGQVLTQALGNPFGPGEVETIDRRVVGVAKDAQINDVGAIPHSYVYLPAVPGGFFSLQLLVKSSGDSATAAAMIREVVADLEPTLVARVRPLEANLEIWRALAGLVSSLSASLGALALVLAAVGIYGVVAYGVGRRVRELGIRLALGASARSVVTLTLRRTMRPVVVGAVVGAAAALGVSQLLASVLFGVSPLDPIALSAAVLFVSAVALVAGFLPARRAMRVDPMTTLRDE